MDSQAIVQMVGQTDQRSTLGLTNQWSDGWTNKPMVKWKDTSMVNAWTDKPMDGEMDQLIERWMSSLME